MPIISVIVPVYNVEPYIHSCVDSILKQTFSDFELILIDDGSQDNCPSICDDYAQIDNRIHVIHQENGGLSAARNAGIDIAKGEFLTFVDSDDLIHPRFLELLYDDILNNNNDITICQYQSFETNIVFQKTGNCVNDCLSAIDACGRIYYLNNIDSFVFVTAWGKLYKKTLFQNIRYPVGRIHEDQFVTYKLIYASNTVGLVWAPLYGYRNNPTGIMRSKFTLKRYDDLDALNEAKAFFENKNEKNVVELVQKRINWTLATYSFYTRQNGLYKNLDRAYRLSFKKAFRILIKEWGIDKTEYFVYQFHPRYIIMRSIIRKIKSSFKELISFPK